MTAPTGEDGGRTEASTSGVAVGADPVDPIGGSIRKPGRPRSVQCDHAILEATLELLAQHGYDGLSMESVAARAGVGKTTIYRRWPSKAPLVVDAVAQAADRFIRPETGDLRQDLIGLLQGLIDRMTTGEAARVLSGVVAGMAHNRELALSVREVFLARRRSRCTEILKRGVAGGEIRPDVDLDVVADLLASPVFYRVLLRGAPVNHQLAEHVVDVLLRGISTAPERAAERKV